MKTRGCIEFKIQPRVFNKATVFNNIRQCSVTVLQKSKNCYKIMLHLFCIINALDFISRFAPCSPFFYTKYNPSAIRIRECTDCFPCSFGNFIFGFFYFEVIPFDAI